MVVILFIYSVRKNHYSNLQILFVSSENPDMSHNKLCDIHSCFYVSILDTKYQNLLWNFHAGF